MTARYLADEFIRETGDHLRRRIGDEMYSRAASAAAGLGAYVRDRYTGRRTVRRPGFSRAGSVKGSIGSKLPVYRSLRGSGDFALVQRQLSIGMTQWCHVQASCQARIYSTTANAQKVQTFMCAKAEPTFGFATESPGGGDIAAVRTWADCVRTQFNVHDQGVLDALLMPLNATGAVSTVKPMPRTAWDMGTAWQLRDMIAYAYDMYDTAALKFGYRYPYYVGNLGAREVYTGGYPNVFDSQKLAYPRYRSSIQGTDMGTGVSPTVPGTVVAMEKLHQLYKRAPLFVDYEEMQFDFYNPSEAKMQVELYECILKKDIPIVASVKGLPADLGDQATSVQPGSVYLNKEGLPVGALPDPVAMWERYMEYVDTFGHQTSVPDTAADQDAGIVDEEAVLGRLPATAAWTGAVDTVMDGTDEQPYMGRTQRSVTNPGMKPMGKYLSDWYRVKPHRFWLEAGSRRSVVIRVRHGRCPQYMDIMERYGRAGTTRTFMLVVNGERVLAKNTAQSAAQLTTGTVPADVICHWTRRAKFCRVNTRPDKKTLDLSVPLRTDINKLQQVDAEEGDFEDVVQQA